MSGGSMNYLSERVLDAEFSERTALRRAFRAHLNKVAAALHAIEWNDSGDGYDGEERLIKACLAPHAELAQLIVEANAAREALTAELDRAES